MNAITVIIFWRDGRDAKKKHKTPTSFGLFRHIFLRPNYSWSYPYIPYLYDYICTIRLINSQEKGKKKMYYFQNLQR